MPLVINPAHTTALDIVHNLSSKLSLASLDKGLVVGVAGMARFLWLEIQSCTKTTSQCMPAVRQPSDATVAKLIDCMIGVSSIWMSLHQSICTASSLLLSRHVNLVPPALVQTFSCNSLVFHVSCSCSVTVASFTQNSPQTASTKGLATGSSGE